MTNWGLTETQETILREILKRYFSQGQVIIYGSRAKEIFHSRSDVDLVIKGACCEDRHLLAELKTTIEESNFPYLCDIQYWKNIKNPALKEHIQRNGQVFVQL